VVEAFHDRDGDFSWVFRLDLLQVPCTVLLYDLLLVVRLLVDLLELLEGQLVLQTLELASAADVGSA